MKYEEVRNVLTLLRANYPQSFAYYNEESGKMLLDIWYEGLKGLDGATVKKAVSDIIMNDSGAFAPTIGQVRKKILSQNTNGSEEEALAAWQLVKKWMRNMNHDYSDAERYRELPETVRFIYSLADLRIMGEQNTVTYNDNYERPRFLKAYKQLKETTELRIMDNGQLQKLVTEQQEALKIQHHE